MKIKKRWRDAILKTAEQNKDQHFPWTRGTVRREFIAARAKHEQPIFRLTA